MLYSKYYCDGGESLGRQLAFRCLGRVALIFAIVLGISLPTFVVAEDSNESTPEGISQSADSPPAPVDPPAPASSEADDPQTSIEEQPADPIEDPGQTEPIVENEVVPVDQPTEPEIVVNDDADPIDEDTDNPVPDQSTDPIDDSPEQGVTPDDGNEVPTESQDESTLDETAALPATPDLNETSLPPPDSEPAIPFDPEVTCVTAPDSAAPVSGDQDWAYLDCATNWETSDVSTVSLLPVNTHTGWEIVPLNDRKLQNPNQMILNPQPLDLQDADSDNDQFSSSRFHLALRVSCIDESAVTVPLKFRSTSGEKALQESASVSLPLSARAATLPEVTLTSAVFEDASPPNGTTVSTGVISMNYSGASEHCGWNITTTVDDFVAPEGVLLASDLTLVEVSGPSGLTSSIEGGVVTVHAAPGVTIPSSGTISITVSIPVPETVDSGVYSTTITADAGVP